MTLLYLILFGIILIAIPFVINYRKSFYGVHQRVEISKFMEGYINIITTIKYKGIILNHWCDVVLSEDGDTFAEQRNKEAKEFYANYKKANS